MYISLVAHASSASEIVSNGFKEGIPTGMMAGFKIFAPYILAILIFAIVIRTIDRLIMKKKKR